MSAGKSQSLADLEAARKAAADAVIQSESRRRLVVAGPGTGKTYLFREALKKAGSGLAVTFINNLADALADELGALAEVRTCHGLAKKLLYQVGAPGLDDSPAYYPALDELIADDLSILGVAKIRGDELARLLADDGEGEAETAAIQCGDYYQAVSHSTCVYRVRRVLSQSRSAIPSYPLVVVDEFQDFNRSEARFVATLAKASPVLIVGDDDQALYGFKGASPEFLRTLATRDDYELFRLPYSSRCTDPIVEAVQLTLSRAEAIGLLSGRITKPFVCYLPGKQDDSEAFPKVVHCRCTVERGDAPYVSRYVEHQIASLDEDIWSGGRGIKRPIVLVIGPKAFLGRAYECVSARTGRSCRLARSEKQPLDLADGYAYLRDEPASNLGWRVVLHVTKPSSWQDAVRDAVGAGRPLAGQMDGDFVKLHLDQARREKPDGAPVALGGAEAPNEADEREGKAEIVFASPAGAKGLEADHVFVVGMNEGHLPVSNTSPTDDEVRQFIVALTRARKSCTLVSAGRLGEQQLNDSCFVNWIGPVLERYSLSKSGLRRLDPLSS